MDDRDREVTAECIADLERAKGALDDAPHRVAREAIRLIDSVISVLGERFPGHEYAGKCAFCEEPKGVDEVIMAGDELACTLCADEALKQPST